MAEADAGGDDPMNVPTYDEGYERGQQARRDGIPASPWDDEVVREAINSRMLPAGAFIDYLSGWNTGWHHENSQIEVRHGMAVIDAILGRQS